MDLSDFYLERTRRMRPPAAGWGRDSGCCWSGFEHGPPASPLWRRSSSCHRRLQTHEGDFSGECRAGLRICQQEVDKQSNSLRRKRNFLSASSAFSGRLSWAQQFHKSFNGEKYTVSVARDWSQRALCSANHPSQEHQLLPKLSGQSHPLFPPTGIPVTSRSSCVFQTNISIKVWLWFAGVITEWWKKSRPRKDEEVSKCLV